MALPAIISQSAPYIPYAVALAQGIGAIFSARDLRKFQKRFERQQSNANAVSALSGGKINIEPDVTQESGLGSKLFNTLGIAGTFLQQGKALQSQIEGGKAKSELSQAQALMRQRLNKIAKGRASIYLPKFGASAEDMPEMQLLSPEEAGETSYPDNSFFLQGQAQERKDLSEAEFLKALKIGEAGRAEQGIELEEERLQRGWAELEQTKRARQSTEDKLALDQSKFGYEQGRDAVDDQRYKEKLGLEHEKSVQSSVKEVINYVEGSTTTKFSELLQFQLSSAIATFINGGPFTDINLINTLQRAINDPGVSVREGDVDLIRSVESSWKSVGIAISNLTDKEQRKLLHPDTRRELMRILRDAYTGIAGITNSTLDLQIQSIQDSYPLSREGSVEVLNNYKLQSFESLVDQVGSSMALDLPRYKDNFKYIKQLAAGSPSPLPMSEAKEVIKEDEAADWKRRFGGK